jgi:hypothetical protein
MRSAGVLLLLSPLLVLAYPGSPHIPITTAPYPTTTGTPSPRKTDASGGTRTQTRTHSHTHSHSHSYSSNSSRTDIYTQTSESKSMTLPHATLPPNPTSLPTTILCYTGGQPVTLLGKPQLEGQNLGDKVPNNTGQVYIKPGTDQRGVPALQYHRDAHFRRAEVEALGVYGPEKTYRIEYHFSLTRSFEKLVVFQW